MAIHRFDVRLPHGISLACRANHRSVADFAVRPRVVLLHGFPEAAFVWDEVITRLDSDAAMLAPNLRGYERSSAPASVADYRARHVVQDLVALVEMLGAPIDLLVAHDWGGALAWVLAAQRPDLLRHLLIVNAPHHAIFLRELRDNPRQQQASAYMTFLCRPDAAALLRADDHARLWRFFTGMGGLAWLDDATKERYRDVWRLGLEGALNYYRASPLQPPQDDNAAIHRIRFDESDVRVNVPTTVLWGERDSALPASLLDGLDAFVPDLEIERVPDGTHWLVHEQPGRIIDTVRRCLRRAEGRPRA